MLEYFLRSLMAATVITQLETARVNDPRWPTGSFALVETTDGCPGSDLYWDHVLVQLGMPGLIAWKPVGSHLLIQVRAGMVLINYCVNGVRTINDTIDGIAYEGGVVINNHTEHSDHHDHEVADQERLWPAGKYCILKAFNKPCPTGLDSGHLRQSFPDGYFRSGTWTAGITEDQNVTTLEYCCQHSGDPDVPVSLATDIPFSLIPLEAGRCQQVTGMTSSLESLTLPHAALQGDMDSAGYYGYYSSSEDGDVTLYICYYIQAEFESTLSVTLAMSLSVITSCLLVMVCVGACYHWLKASRTRPHRQTLLHVLRRKSTTGGDCYVQDGKVLCNETQQTEADSGLGCLLSSILAPHVKDDLQPLLLPRDSLQVQEKIGEGAYGTVLKATYRDLKDCKRVVAVKSCKYTCSNEEVVHVIDEALLMTELQHPNLLGLIGVSVDDDLGLPMLVMPFMEYFDLQTYLRRYRYDDEFKDKELSVNTMLSFALQIATGMTYLASKKCAHRDLAARNCMVSSELMVKIADFGLARDLYQNSYYRQIKESRLPIKWMALESLQDRVFTVNSDVWSYGVTCWEIFTLGKTPYPSMENAQVLRFISGGGRLERPSSCPESIFELMLQCWKDIPRERPAFETIRKVIDNYLMKDSDYLVLTCDAEITSENSSPTMQSRNGHSLGIGDSVSLGDKGHIVRLSPVRDQERTVSVTDLTRGDVECGNTVSDFSGAKNSPSTSFVADVVVPTETYL